MKKLFVVISDNGSLRAGNATRQSLGKLKDNGFEQVNHSDDFLNTLSNGENSFFLPKDAQDIQNLCDETNLFSISHYKKEAILQAYAKTK